MILRLREKRGQSILEYTVIIVVIAGALTAMTFYIKRAVQGRWKDTVDSLGDQYDSNAVNSVINHVITSTTNTSVYIDQVGGNKVTMRNDTSNSSETKTGYVNIGDLP